MAGTRRGRLAIEEKNKQNTTDGRGDQREDDDAVAEQNATGYRAQAHAFIGGVKADVHGTHEAYANGFASPAERRRTS